MTLSKSVLGSVAAVSLTVISAFASVPAQTSACNYMFNTNLRLGAVSTDVQNLQKLLNMDASTKVASTGAGSMGYETLRFGPATLAAVKKFQTANGITPVSGYVGPLTRATLNTICTGNGNTSTTPTTNTGNSGVSSNSIPVSVLVAGQAGAKLGEFVVSGNGMVTQITLQRTGLSNNSTLANVYLYDGATRLTDASSVRTDGSITFNSTSGLFAVSGSKTITVKADILSGNGTSGQTVGVALTGVTMMGGTMTPVNGVAGPLFSISSASTATANFTTATPNPAATSINAGSVNQTLWSNTISIGTNPAKLNGATFKMIGSAPANSLANVQLYVDGVSVGSANINMNMQYVFTSSVPLNTGSHLLELRGDVVAGSFRSFYITVERGTDLVIEDSTLPGINVSVTSAGNTLTNMGGTANQISINQGSLTVTQDPAFNNTTNIVGGASQVKLGSFKMTAYGEDVKFISLPITITNSTALAAVSGGNTTLANVGLYVNGAQVGANTNPFTLVSGGTSAAVTLSGLSNLYIPAGQSVTVDVRADIMNSSSVAYTAGTLQVNLGAGQAQGVSSSNTFTSSSQSGQVLTIGNNVTFGSTAGFSTSTKAPNTTMNKIGSFSIQAGSAEGLTVNSIVVSLSNIMSNQLTNLVVKDASTGNVVGTPIGNPIAGNNNYSANINVPVSSTKVFDIYADFGSSATGSVTPTVSITYRGSISNLSLNTSAVAGAATSVGTAVLYAGGVTLNTGLSPVSQLVIGGQTAFNIGTFNFVSTSSISGSTIQDIGFTVPANTVTSITVNGKTANVVGTNATVTAVNLAIPANTGGVQVPVTVSLACVGTGCAYMSGNATATVSVSAFTYNNGTTTVTVGGVTAATNNMYLVGSKPALTVNSTQQTGLNTSTGVENKIGEVTIAADAAGQVKVNTITFNLSNSGYTSTPLTYSAVRIADGNTTIPGSSCTVGGVCTLGTTPNGYAVGAGQSKTFSLYAIKSAGVPGSNVVVSESSSVTSAGFAWDDVNGGGTGLTGANIYNFPTGAYSIRQ